MSTTSVKQKTPVYDDSEKYDISTKSRFLKALFRNVMRARFAPSFLITMAICAIIVISGRMLNLVRVVGSSMYPAFYNGDLVITSVNVTPDKIDYGTVVIYDVPVGEGVDPENPDYKMVVKRVVGMPGDTIQVVDGVLYRNSVLVDEPGLDLMEDAGCAKEPVTLGEDEYFCLGDNRNASMDSRKTGSVSIENITHIVKRKVPLFSN